MERLRLLRTISPFPRWLTPRHKCLTSVHLAPSSMFMNTALASHLTNCLRLRKNIDLLDINRPPYIVSGIHPLIILSLAQMLFCRHHQLLHPSLQWSIASLQFLLSNKAPTSPPSHRLNILMFSRPMAYYYVRPKRFYDIHTGQIKWSPQLQGDVQSSRFRMEEINVTRNYGSRTSPDVGTRLIFRCSPR